MVSVTKTTIIRNFSACSVMSFIDCPYLTPSTFLQCLTSNGTDYDDNMKRLTGGIGRRKGIYWVCQMN